ncbi:MAG TPA: acyl-CoA dehydrogenase [Magnetospirillaceae bacterium]|nr:acyl-CoA dehydrogenase [Magnetospirillaceae bacterium]
MAGFTAPLRDMEFVFTELAGLDPILSLLGEDYSPELVSTVLAEAGKIAEGVIAPLNHPGDKQGAKIENGTVRVADGWQAAYDTLVEGNWIGLPFPAEHGGMGLPWLVNAATSELWAGANTAFALSTILTQGATHAIISCGSDEQKATYLPKLVSGAWAGTMVLTEAGAGSDLAAIRTKAVKHGDHYRISGQKIFITYGDHEMTPNIIHMVLARTPDAPPGVKGISLFIVPKFLVNADGSLGSRNDLRAVSLEHKLGIHASPTAVMSFGDNEGAIGYLVGEEGRGLEFMFIMMNNARLNVGLQGVALAERAYQQALGYARERVQGKALGKSERGPIIDHPDVRRLLFTMKARTEAMRALAYVEAAALDHAEHGSDEQKRQGQLMADFLNPIVKGWCTESGIQVASAGVQVHGGMGFIEETGAAQHYRDVRITAIYEGTTAIQANDLINRKLGRDKGAVAKMVLDEVKELAVKLKGSSQPELASIGRAMEEAQVKAVEAVDWTLAAGAEDARLPAAGSVPLLMLLGTVLGGHQMARAAEIAAAKLSEGDFYVAKLATAQHYALHVLPEALALARTVTDGSKTVMSLESALF